jgi:hypothetical protein
VRVTAAAAVAVAGEAEEEQGGASGRGKWATSRVAAELDWGKWLCEFDEG